MTTQTRAPQIHFERRELDERIAKACRAMQEQKLDGLLLFSQESMYYLTGYDSIGYVFFQCMYLGADGRLALLTRAPDLLQAEQTSIVEDIRVWVDRPTANPGLELRGLLEDYRCAGRRLGVELRSYGLTVANWQSVAAALDGFCTLEDASLLVTKLRVVKSPAEIAYVEKAAALVDQAFADAVALTKPGAFEGDILAALQSPVLRADGEFAAIQPILGSGPGALLCRPYAGRRRLDAQDQLTIEFCATYRRYHAALMRTVVLGEPKPMHRRMHAAGLDALEACKAALRPGRPIGEVFDAFAKVCDAAGLREQRGNATGYSLGTTFPPNWMDWPMFYAGNPVLAEPNMVFFIHIILADAKSVASLCSGQTVVVTEDGCRPLTKFSLEMLIK